MMILMYPDVEDTDSDDPCDMHPMTAVGTVLLSAAFLGSINRKKLVTFTGYSSLFISAINLNMANNRLWVSEKYDHSTWLLSSGNIERERFWDHIDIACGYVWTSEADIEYFVDTCKIYWQEREGFSIDIGG
ncbi:MAG TPA: hypothetical protein VE843_08820 [Ktedonobacteraceae bacterium]|nr:hypothetical protein [Ktedonobacteraceae bacterium]